MGFHTEFSGLKFSALFFFWRSTGNGSPPWPWFFFLRGDDGFFIRWHHPSWFGFVEDICHRFPLFCSADFPLGWPDRLMQFAGAVSFALVDHRTH